MSLRKGQSSVLRSLAAVGVAAVLAGCATKNDIRQFQEEVRAELRSLAERQDSLIAELRIETLSTQDTVRTQSDQLFDFRGEITRQLRAIAEGQRRLEALAGENQRGIASVRDQLATSRRLSTQSQTQPLVEDTSAVAGRGSESLAGTGGNADQLWSAAREMHNRGSYGTAQVAYDQFLEEYPNHERAPDAHFFLADILTQQDRPEDALEAFQEIQALYPTSPRVPEALYRIALIQVEMGDTDEATATLERIINTYPDAFVTTLARDLLEEIG